MTKYSKRTEELLERKSITSDNGEEVLKQIIKKLLNYSLGLYALKAHHQYVDAYKEVLSHPDTLLCRESREVALELLRNTIEFASGKKDPTV